jgi:hypothetical protein
MACASQEDSILGAEVDEYLRTMGNSSGADSMSPRSSDSDNMLLWPEALYPDMYGKTLNGVKKREFVDAEDFTLSSAFVSPCAACMYTSALTLSC